MSKKKRKKTGGREAGTPNKVTTALRERVDLLIDNNFERLQDDIDSLEPKERVDAILKLLEFTLPKLQRVDMETVEKKNIESIDIAKLTDEQKDVLLTIGEDLLNDLD